MSNALEYRSRDEPDICKPGGPPGLCAEMHKAWADGDKALAARINDRLYPLHEALFLEPNPQGVKYAASVIGKAAADVRLPLVDLTRETKTAIEEALEFAGLI